jgi:hypothetical protein
MVSYLGSNSNVNKVLDISCLGYNPKFCDLKSLLVIWDSRTQCVLFALQFSMLFNFHLHIILVFWFPSCVLGLDSNIVTSELVLGFLSRVLALNYHCVWMVGIMFGWYYVVWFMCVDNEDCKCQHRSTWQRSHVCLKLLYHLLYNLKFGITCINKTSYKEN